MLTVTPRLILKAIKQGNFNLLVLALDATVPPVTLLGMLATGMVAVAGFTGAIFLSWLKFGRDIVPPGEVFFLVFYVIKKLPLYFKMLLRNSVRGWIRTDRRKV